jgi:hypothetical protein
MATFSSEVFNFIKTLVPYWRVSDDAWRLADGSYLTGIGVLRNFGGSVMVIPWDKDRHQQLAALRFSTESLPFDRVIIVVDDRIEAAWERIADDLSPFTVSPWSRRNELAGCLANDRPSQAP